MSCVTGEQDESPFHSSEPPMPALLSNLIVSLSSLSALTGQAEASSALTLEEAAQLCADHPAFVETESGLLACTQSPTPESLAALQAEAPETVRWLYVQNPIVEGAPSDEPMLIELQS